MLSLLKTFTSDQKRVLFGISLSYILSWCPGIMTSPFLPSEAALHGVSTGLTGLLFSVSSVTTIIASPLMGILIGKVGPKKVVILGVIAGSCGSILVGMLQHVEGKWLFVAGCFCALMCSGLGVTAIYTASLTYAANLFPENMSLIVGATEGYIGIGEMIALPLGGAMHDAAGFMTPFLVFGIVLILTLPLNLWLLPKDDMEAAKRARSIFGGQSETTGLPELEAGEKGTGFAMATKRNKLMPWDLFKIPPALFMILVVVVTGVSWLFISTTLEPHLAPLDLTKTQVGSVFVVSPAMYVIACPAWGYVADRVRNSRRFMIIVAGLVLGGFTFAFLGPLPFLGIENSIPSNVITLIVVTIWLGAAFVPACESCLVYCVESGYEDNLETYATVSGWISMAFAIGAATGASVGGYLVEAIGYPYSAGIFGIFCTFSGLVILVIFGLKLPCSRSRAYKNDQMSNEKFVPVALQ